MPLLISNFNSCTKIILFDLRICQKRFFPEVSVEHDVTRACRRGGGGGTGCPPAVFGARTEAASGPRGLRPRRDRHRTQTGASLSEHAKARVRNSRRWGQKATQGRRTSRGSALRGPLAEGEGAGPGVRGGRCGGHRGKAPGSEPRSPEGRSRGAGFLGETPPGRFRPGSGSSWLPGPHPRKGRLASEFCSSFSGTQDGRGSGRLRSREFVSRHKKRHRGRLQELLAAIKNFQRPVELPSGAFPEATAGRTGRVGTSQSVGRQQKAECSEAASSRTAGRAAWPSAQVCCAHSMLASKCDRRRCESCPAGRRQVVSSCRLANDVSCKTTETCFLRKSSAVRFHYSGTTGIVCVSSATHDPRHAA